MHNLREAFKEYLTGILFSESSNLIFSIDNRGNILEWNETFGKSSDVNVGVNIGKYLIAISFHKLLNILTNFKDNSPQKVSLNFIFSQYNIPYTYECWIVPIPEKNFIIYGELVPPLNYNDMEKYVKITNEMGHLNRELQKSKYKLEQLTEDLRNAKEAAEKANQLKTRFLATMTHDIRTPLSAIMGIINHLSNTEMDGEQKDYIKILGQSADYMLSLVNDVLDISKIESGKLELEEIDFNIKNMIEKIYDTLKFQANKKRIDLFVEIDPNMPDNLRGDPVKFRQIIFNLLGNSIKFTHKGRVTLKVNVDYIEGEYILLDFSISDTGVGIPEDKLKILFSDYSQADASISRKYGGTGLGLSIVKRLVELMNGNIYVKSEEGKGSIFYFKVRLKVPQILKKEITVPYNYKGERCLKNYNILLAEDDFINQKVISSVLRKRGHFVKVVNNGRECLDILKKENFDIVLMDCEMPVMTGLEAIKQIRVPNTGVLNHNIPVIVITGHSFLGDREIFLKAGMDDYITKPINVRDLIEIVEKNINKTNPSVLVE